MELKAYDIYRHDTEKNAIVYCEEEMLYDLIADFEAKNIKFSVMELCEANSYQICPDGGFHNECKAISYSVFYERVYFKGRWMTNDEYKELAGLD